MKLLKSEWLKTKHTALRWIHLIMPVLGACIFLAYSAISPWDTSIKLTFYFEALSLAFPLLISIVTGLSAEQEQMAGGLQNMLSVTALRIKVLVGKLLMLVLLALVALILAVGLYAMGFGFIEGQDAPGPSLYLWLLAALFASNLFLYQLHLFVSLRFGKGASIGLGVVGSLLAALMLTGLGDTIWYAVPWAWSVRFCDQLIQLEATLPLDTALFIKQELLYGVFVMLPMLLLMTAFVLLWFRRYEGHASNE